MASGSDRFTEVLLMAAKEVDQPAWLVAAMTEELGNGFASRQTFCKDQLKKYASDTYGFWVDSCTTKISYAVDLDLSSLTDTSIGGTLLGTTHFSIPPEHRPPVLISRGVGGQIIMQLTK